MKKYITIHTVFLVIVLLLSIPIILPFFHTGYFPTHDGEWAVVRLAEMFRELRDHQIPPRFSGVLNYEYGYPLFNFAYPFPYYLGIIFHFFKFDFVSSIKILFALSVPISAAGMFLASSKLWKSSYAGFVSSLLYLYLPYRFVDLYVRGSLGESLSFAIFPLLFYFAILIYEYPKKYMYVTLFSFTYAALIMTHNIMAVLFSIPLLILLLAISYEDKKATIRLLFAFVMGGLVSSFFFIPALLEKNLILLSKIPIADRTLYFVQPSQLVIPSWGYGVPTDLTGAFSYQLGWPHILLFVFTLGFIIFATKFIKNPRKEFKFRVSIALCIISLIFLCLLFSPSLIIWKNTPLLSEINYPWTLLAPIGFLISLICGYGVVIGNRFKYLFIIVALGGAIFFLPYAKPQEYSNKPDIYYSTNEATTTSSSELMPLWVKEFPKSASMDKVFIKGKGSISSLAIKSNKISFTVNLMDKSTIRINKIYYPGWKAYVNGRSVPIEVNNPQGVMELSLFKGTYDVMLKFGETPLRLFADVISIVAVAILLLYGLFASRVKFLRP